VPRLLDNLPALKELLYRRPFGLITDMDGTISPKSTDPLHVIIPAANRSLLRVLSERLDLVAVISGRSATEVRQMVDGDRILCIGHYGMEWWQDDKAVLHPDVQSYLPVMRKVASQLDPLETIPGVIIQDKGATISMHYRLSPNPEQAKERILEFLESLPQMHQLRILTENMVIGIIPPAAINKGTEVRDLIKQRELRGGMYLGDDTADILGFKAIHEANAGGIFKGFGIAVTDTDTVPEVASTADYVLNGVGETKQMLGWMAAKHTNQEDSAAPS
jgi:trehalose 6-phosphate phosphatase